MATTGNMELPEDVFEHMEQLVENIKSDVFRQIEKICEDFLRSIRVVDRSQQVTTANTSLALNSLIELNRLVVNTAHNKLQSEPIAYYTNSNGQLVPTPLMTVQPMPQRAPELLAPRPQQQYLTPQQQTIVPTEGRQLTSSLLATNHQEQQVVNYLREQLQRQERVPVLLVRPEEVTRASLNQNQSQQLLLQQHQQYLTGQQQSGSEQQFNQPNPWLTNFQDQNQSETATETHFSQTNDYSHISKEEMVMDSSSTITLDSDDRNPISSLGSESSTSDFASSSSVAQNESQIEQTINLSEEEEIRSENQQEREVIDVVDSEENDNADAHADDNGLSNSYNLTEEHSYDFCPCSDCNDDVEWLPSKDSTITQNSNEAPSVSKTPNVTQRCTTVNSNSQPMRTVDSTPASTSFSNLIDCSRIRSKLNTKMLNNITQGNAPQPSQQSIQQAQTPQQQTSTPSQLPQVSTSNTFPQASTSTVPQPSSQRIPFRRGRPQKHFTPYRSRAIPDRQKGNFVCRRCKVPFTHKHLLRKHQTSVHGWGGARLKGSGNSRKKKQSFSIAQLQTYPIPAVTVQPSTLNTSDALNANRFEPNSSAASFTSNDSRFELVNSADHFSLTNPNVFYPVNTDQNGGSDEVVVRESAIENIVIGGHCICHLCNTSFANQFNLNRHLFRHQKVKPFTCKWPGCNKSSSQKPDVVRHIRVQHFGLPYTLKEQKKKEIVEYRDPNDFIHEDKNLMLLLRQSIPEK